jgi:hypothetical protein
MGARSPGLALADLVCVAPALAAPRRLVRGKVERRQCLRERDRRRACVVSAAAGLRRSRGALPTNPPLRCNPSLDIGPGDDVGAGEKSCLGVIRRFVWSEEGCARIGSGAGGAGAPRLGRSRTCRRALSEYPVGARRRDASLALNALSIERKRHEHPPPYPRRRDHRARRVCLRHFICIHTRDLPRRARLSTAPFRRHRRSLAEYCRCRVCRIIRFLETRPV